MKAQLSYKNNNNGLCTISIPGSKSESNRILILQAQYPNISIENCSNSEDTLSLVEGLENAKGKVNIGHAGTAMRFLTAYYASQEGLSVVLTGSDRMKERPIKILVDALKDLGAEINYLKKPGFPPLQIQGKELNDSSVSVKTDISSQYITALLLIAPSLSNGLKLELEGEITSKPYIDMTIQLLQDLGISSSILKNKIEEAVWSYQYKALK